MTDINDFGEPIGYDDDPDPDYQPAPPDLDALDEAACIALNGDDQAAREKASAFVLGEAHRLVAECRAAREQLAEWQALETREEWAVTFAEGERPDPDAPILGGTAEKAAPYARIHKGQMWRRTFTVRPWEPVELDPPS